MKIKLLILLWLNGAIMMAQTSMGLSSAIQTALANNLQLQIARNDAQIAHNNNHAGNAGMLPNVSLNASDNPSLTNINQKYVNGTSIERKNVFSNTLSANVLGTYVLYDGMKMYATKHKLEALDRVGNTQLQGQIQNTISRVVISYSNIIRQQQYLEVVKQLNELSEQRLEIVKARQIAGVANNTDVYLAQLDLETRKQSLLSQKAIVKNAYTDLNLILNIKADSVYQIEPFALRSSPLQKGELDSMLIRNPDLMLAHHQLDIAEQTQKEISAAQSPLLRLTGAYNYNLTQSQAGFALLNQSNGPQAGISLSVPLFTGHINSRNYANAKLNVQSSKWRETLTLQTIQASYQQTWENYSTALVQMQSDELAIGTAKQYMELMQLRFKNGQNTIIELKEAQRSYEETYYRYISNQYIAKLAETQLLGLTGQLVN